MAENEQIATPVGDASVNAAHPVFAIEKLYVRDLSLEVPAGAAAFLHQQSPEVGVQFKTAFSQLGDDVFEGVLQVTVTAQAGETVYFLIELQQAGVFRVAGIPEDALRPFLASAVPNILFPYAREAVSDASTRAGFPPVVLQPVNFDAMAETDSVSSNEVDASTTVQ